jgi:GNAT superfamily N-acetyltransferase
MLAKNENCANICEGSGILKNPALIEYAIESELPTVLRMYMNALKEIPNIGEIDPQSCAKTVYDSWLQAPCLLLKESGKIIGFAGLRLSKNLHNFAHYISEYMFYVEPEYRSVKNAKLLADGAKELSDKMGLELRFSHLLQGNDVTSKFKLMKRWGYEPYSLAVSYGGK